MSILGKCAGCEAMSRQINFMERLIETLQAEVKGKGDKIAELAQPLINARLAHAERVIGRERERQQGPPPPMRHSAGALRNRREDRPSASGRVGPPTAGEMASAKQSAAEVEASFTES